VGVNYRQCKLIFISHIATDPATEGSFCRSFSDSSIESLIHTRAKNGQNRIRERNKHRIGMSEVMIMPFR
jgi:hypothetical protein